MEKENIDIEEMLYAVDIPQVDREEWVAVEYFKTEKEALEFTQKRFGADKDGLVCLLRSLF